MAFATDDFSLVSGDVNGDSLSGGGTWTHHTQSDFSDGVLQAQSGGVAQATNGVDCVYYASPDPASADYEVQMTVAATVAGSIGTRGLGVAGRISTSTASAYILYRDQTGLYLYKAVAGVYTLLGSYSTAAANNTNYVLKLSMQGSTIKGFLDGVERISTSDLSIGGGGKAGIYSFAAYTFNLASGWIGDNFSATDLPPVAKTASDAATATEGSPSVVALSSTSASDAATATDAASVGVATDTQFAADTFAGASGGLNGDPLSGGGTWAKMTGSLFSGGSLVEDSGAFRSAVQGVDSGYLASPTPGSADQTVELDVWAPDVGVQQGTGGIGVIARGSASAGDAGYVAYVDRTTVYLGKIVGGVWTTLASAAWSPVAGTHYRLALATLGPALAVKIDGVVKASASDATHSIVGSAGLYAFAKHSSTDASSWHGDNFAASATTVVTGSSLTASDAATATDATPSIAIITQKSANDSAAATDTASILVQIGGRPWPSALASWSRRAEITVTGHRAALTNYPVKVTLSYAASMKADFADLRFTDTSGTQLTYWRDHYTSSVSAVFWVVMSTTPGNGLTDTIIAYYGNASASYTGAALGANGIFLNYDGGSGSAISHSAHANLAIGTSGAWDDRYIFNPRWVKNLDGTLYRDGNGDAWGIYLGANTANGVSISGPGDDRPGLFKMSSAGAITKISTSTAILSWDAGTWHPTDGTYMDGRVLQTWAVYWDGSQFVMLFDGDRGPAHVKEDYSWGVATAPAPSGASAQTVLSSGWTKANSGNTIFQSSHSNTPGYADTVAYGGDAIYDPDEPDANKCWKAWYTGLPSAYTSPGGYSSSRWGVLYATAPTPTGPWTKYTTDFIWQPAASGGIYDGGVDRVFKVRGIYYMIWETYGVPKWAANVAASTDGITWTNLGEIFTLGASGTWDTGRTYWLDIAYDAATDTYRAANSGLYTGGTLSGEITNPGEVAIGATGSFTATRPPQSDDPTTSVGTEQSTSGATDSATATDVASVTVGVGAIQKTATDSATTTDTGSRSAVTRYFVASDSAVVTDSSGNNAAPKLPARIVKDTYVTSAQFGSRTVSSAMFGDRTVYIHPESTIEFS